MKSNQHTLQLSALGDDSFSIVIASGDSKRGQLKRLVYCARYADPQNGVIWVEEKEGGKMEVVYGSSSIQTATGKYNEL